MPSTITDRLEGLTTSVAVKAPCRVGTTANITLSGLQTIDGVTVVAGDRVLVKDQTNAVDNGIWIASSATWTRAADFDGTFDVVGGSWVKVNSGTANANSYWTVDGDGEKMPGTDSIAFSTSSGNLTLQVDLASTASGKGADLVSFIQTGTGAVARTMLDKAREAYSVTDFGAVGDGVTDDSTAIQAALDAAAAAGKDLFVPEGTYLLSTRQDTYSGTKALIIVPTGVDIKISGEGIGSKFTIPNSFSGTGASEDYSFFWSSSASDHGKIEICGIHIDGNAENNLVIDSSTNVRRGYGFRLIAGDEFYCHDCHFTSMAGRNVLNIAGTVSPASWNVTRIINNSFVDCGGAIAGNENQSDHSTIYMEAIQSIITGNYFNNTNTAFDPIGGSPACTVTAIEEHSEHAVVGFNNISNYGYGMISVGSVADGAYSQMFIGNVLRGMKGNSIGLYSGAPLRRTAFYYNTVEVDNSTYSGGNGFFQSTLNAVTTNAIEDLRIIGNRFVFKKATAATTSLYGVYVTAASSLLISDNYFENCQASGIALDAHASTLGIENAVIENNTFKDCGLHSINARPWAITIRNPDTNKVFRNIKVRSNLIMATPQAAGSSPLLSRGIVVIGGGHLQDIEIETPDTRGTIQRGQRVTFSTTTNNKNVVQVPKRVVLAKASSPIRGYFEIDGETVIHSDPTTGENAVRVVKTEGSASEATWAGTTAYTVGQWIKTSANKTLECTVAGTSSGVEPTPSTLGEQVTDGTVTWLYKDTVVAALSNYPVYGSISTTTDASGDVTVTHGFGTTPSQVLVTTTGTTFMTPQVHTNGATTFKVRFFDAAGAALATTAVTAYWRAS